MSRNTLPLTFLLLSIAIPGFAQPQQDEPLGDVARQLRERRENEGRKAVKVFTNDNLPEPKPGEAISSLPLPSEKPAAPTQDTSKAATPQSAEETSSKSQESTGNKIKGRDYWQEKFKAARLDVAKAKELQQLSEDELNLLQIQQVRELDQMAKDDLTAKVQAKQSEVDINKATTDAAQKALDDLNRDFKESGAPDDWSQTD
jgi:hypothetical protein